MDHARPLPAYLVQRYHGWKATGYAENKAWYRHLAEQGQHPRAMVISCCDSRVHVTSIFGADQGEFFIHRNIANLVPPCEDRWRPARHLGGGGIRGDRAQRGACDRDRPFRLWRGQGLSEDVLGRGPRA